MVEKMKNRYRQRLGKWGEDIALSFLEKQGCRLISRNYRTPDGEIDLIMLRAETLIFVEVKTRKNLTFGLPEEAITDEKLEHLSCSAEWFLQENPQYSENWQLNVVTVIGSPGVPEPQIDWFDNVS